jgi:Glycosyl hydrolases family 2, sugar binding domain/Glycosyl hydrolases family 2, TIM barrel domain/Glycosyl hydrolases family 2
MKTWLLFLAFATYPALPARADWQPANGPLLTRWAKDVRPDGVHPEYPRPQMVRKDWLNLNGLWQLAFGKQGEEPPLGKDLPERILVPYPVESALSGVMKHGDRLWYRRMFTVPKGWQGKRVLLHFGAVDWEATVWVNGKELGKHQGGYDGFSFDISEALKQEGEQELVVGVWDPTDAGTQPRGKQVLRPSGIYYTPATGIWQTVWLEPVAASYIESLKIVPDLDGGKLHLTVHGKNVPANHTLEVTVVESDQPRATWTFANDVNKTVQIPFADATYWSPESPYLYGLCIAVKQAGTQLDEVESYCAMRKISIGKDERGVTRILLNGKPYFQVGPLDQGFWPDGLYTAPTDEALKYDIEMTKKLGFNMCRKHVKVEPERWYYWCDKLGLLVWQDMPSGDRGVAPGKGEITRTSVSAKQYELELQRMIDGRHNHPCIVMWVVFNEGWGQFDTIRITNWVKHYDPSRLANCASGWNDMQAGDVHDIHVYPGPGSPKPEPNRAAVLGEFGGLGLATEGHMWTSKNWGYRGTRNKDDLTRKYEQLLRGVYKLKDKPGLSAAVYTQTTDVETEANGLMTYDRAVVKLHAERVAAANRGDFAGVADVIEVVPTAREKGQPWRYTLDEPPADWFKPDFDDATWKEGKGGFGTKGTPGAVVRTEWKTSNIWLRREFTLPEAKLAKPHLIVHHDEDVEIYLNGVLAAKARGFLTDYEEMPISPEALATLKPGKNHLAVHCKQTTGGQYIDVGIGDVK